MYSAAGPGDQNEKREMVKSEIIWNIKLAADSTNHVFSNWSSAPFLSQLSSRGKRPTDNIVINWSSLRYWARQCGLQCGNPRNICNISDFKSSPCKYIRYIWYILFDICEYIWYPYQLIIIAILGPDNVAAIHKISAIDQIFKVLSYPCKYLWLWLL